MKTGSAKRRLQNDNILPRDCLQSSFNNKIINCVGPEVVGS